MIPTDEIIDKGFGIVTFGYQDVTKDNNDFTDGLAGVLRWYCNNFAKYKNNEDTADFSAPSFVDW